MGEIHDVSPTRGRENAREKLLIGGKEKRMTLSVTQTWRLRKAKRKLVVVVFIVVVVAVVVVVVVFGVVVVVVVVDHVVVVAVVDRVRSFGGRTDGRTTDV